MADVDDEDVSTCELQASDACSGDVALFQIGGAMAILCRGHFTEIFTEDRRRA